MASQRLAAYLAIGGAIGMIASLVLWAIGSATQLSALAYAVVVLAVYAVGIAASYLAHSAITFKARRSARGVSRHFVVCLAGGCVVATLAALLRAALAETQLDPALNGMLSFIASSLVVSIASYWASRVWVFGERAGDGSR